MTQTVFSCNLVKSVACQKRITIELEIDDLNDVFGQWTRYSMVYIYLGGDIKVTRLQKFPKSTGIQLIKAYGPP